MPPDLALQLGHVLEVLDRERAAATVPPEPDRMDLDPELEVTLTWYSKWCRMRA